MSETGSEAVQLLQKALTDQHILLDWEITRDFTAVPGRLTLMLTGSDSENKVVAKWTGEPIHIRPDPQGSAPVPPPDEVEQFRAQITKAVEKITRELETAQQNLKEPLRILQKAQDTAENLILTADELKNTADTLQTRTIPEFKNYAEKALEEMELILKKSRDFLQYQPRIGKNKTWEIYNKVTNEYVDTGIMAEGKSSYQYAVEQGYQGSEEQFARFQAELLNTKRKVEQYELDIKNAIQKFSSDFRLAKQDIAQAKTDAVTDIADAATAQTQAAASKVAEEGTKQAERLTALGNEISSIVDPTLSIEGKAADAKVTGEKLSQKAPAVMETASGELVKVTDSANAKLQGLTIYGKSVQDGVPTPDNPIPIVSVGDGGSVSITINNGGELSQTLTIPLKNPLYGIPVDSGGNYTDSKGQQWICDEVDFKKSVKRQWIKKEAITKNTFIVRNVVGEFSKFIFNLMPFDENVFISRMIPTLCNKFSILTGIKKLNVYEVLTVGDSGWKGNARVQFYVDKSIETIEQFIQLVGDDLFIIFQLKDAVETPLPKELTEQYTALHTNSPNTTIFNDSNAGQKVNYTADTKLYIDKKIEQLNKQIIQMLPNTVLSDMADKEIQKRLNEVRK